MASYSIQGPDGKTYSIDGPDGASREQVIGAIKAKMGDKFPTAAPAKEKDISLYEGIKDTAIGAGKAIASIPAIGLALGSSPDQSGKDVAEGVKQIPSAMGAASASGQKAIAKDIESTINNPSYYQKALHAGRAALGFPSTLYNTYIGAPYAATVGKLAERGSGGRISPEDASMLPALAMGARSSPGSKMAPVLEKAQARDISAASKYGVTQLPKEPMAAQQQLMGALGQAKDKTVKAATGIESQATTPYQATRRMADVFQRGFTKLNNAASGLYKGVEEPASKIPFTDEKGISEIGAVMKSAKGDGVKLGPELSKFYGQLTDHEQALKEAKLASREAELKATPAIQKQEAEIIKLRTQLRGLQDETLAPDYKIGAKRSELAKARIQQASNKLSNAEQSLERQKSILKIQQDKLAAAKPVKEPITVQKLVAMDRELNGYKYGSAPAERKYYESLQEKIRSQIKTTAPQIADRYEKARTNYENLITFAQGNVAKSLGVDDALSEAIKQSASGKVDLAKIAYQNVQAALKGAEDKIDTLPKIRWLKQLLPAEDYNHVMANVIDKRMNNATPKDLQEFEPLFKNIVTESGLKNQQPIVAYSEAMRLSNLINHTTGFAKLAPEQLRQVKSDYGKLMNGVKSAIGAAATIAHPNPFTPMYAATHAIEATRKTLPEAEQGVARLNAYLNPKAPTPILKNISGPAVGAAIGSQTGGNRQ